MPRLGRLRTWLLPPCNLRPGAAPHSCLPCSTSRRRRWILRFVVSTNLPGLRNVVAPFRAAGDHAVSLHPEQALREPTPVAAESRGDVNGQLRDVLLSIVVQPSNDLLVSHVSAPHRAGRVFVEHADKLLLLLLQRIQLFLASLDDGSNLAKSLTKDVFDSCIVLHLGSPFDELLVRNASCLSTGLVSMMTFVEVLVKIFCKVLSKFYFMDWSKGWKLASNPFGTGGRAYYSPCGKVVAMSIRIPFIATCSRDLRHGPIESRSLSAPLHVLLRRSRAKPGLLRVFGWCRSRRAPGCLFL